MSPFNRIMQLKSKIHIYVLNEPLPNHEVEFSISYFLFKVGKIIKSDHLPKSFEVNFLICIFYLRSEKLVKATITNSVLTRIYLKKKSRAKKPPLFSEEGRRITYGGSPPFCGRTNKKIYFKFVTILTTPGQ